MSLSQSSATRAHRIAAACIALAALAACSDSPNGITPPAPPSDPNLAAIGRDNDLGPALAAQGKHTGRLLRDRDLLGTAVGRLNDGRPEVTVFARNAGAAARVPKDLDGIPVTVEVTGEITALPAVAEASPHAKPGGRGTASVKPTDYARPAYVGMSTGNALECAAGTIGAKISKGGTIYALSNNHVYARENAASLGETIYQPGRYDLSCASGSQYAWATLAFFKSISFGGNNTVDVALAKLNNGGQLNATTPPDGYGAPSSTTANATLNMGVMKYGRTTALTTGVVVGVNVTIRVQYTDGIATFVSQVQIKGDKGAFSRAGDSGSLIVTRTGRNPVALLFAGGQTSTFANPIGPVLQAVGGTIVSQ
jgi:hypothetical protein